ncbi:MAG: PspC domain-containing protein [Ilumatobacter sp.]|uniref:PspC domain-containing protein n=1 Tax=Ilumatobacter sp. TaxID=1967498 RepID=UPI002616BEF7|nr:PspC domain-containing protein [Ilumatobacter sp.]MDJ0767169.1 PspC domain-containing protein [Ilumatobacter sp.]
MARRDRTLYRDTDDKKIGGVCSGLARYFDVDPVLVRVAFVAALVFGGGSLVAYLLLWWLVDPAPAGAWEDEGSGGSTTDSTADSTAGPTADSTDAGDDDVAGQAA